MNQAVKLMLERYSCHSFDTINHEELMKKVQIRIADRQVLKLINMFLNADVIDKDENGKYKVIKNDFWSTSGWRY